MGILSDSPLMHCHHDEISLLRRPLMTTCTQLYKAAYWSVLAYILVDILLQLNDLKSYYNMTNSAKTPAQWRLDFIKLARSNKVNLRGKAPNVNDTANHTTYTKIINCPLWKRDGVKSGTQLNLFNQPTTVASCNCDYGEYHGVPAPEANAPAIAAPPQQQQSIITIPFNIPEKPDPIKRKSNIKDQIKVVETKGKFDLLVFAPTWGRCIHCGSTNITDTNVNDKVKTIRTLGKPRFVQGMGMKCNRCNGKAWQTFESTYVSTLPPEDQHELNAQIVGASDGICMDAVVQMRVNVSASHLEKTSRVNLTRWHTSLKSDYKKKVKASRGMGNAVIEDGFPPMNESYVAKSASITNAFLRDYANHRDSLNREMASIQSEQSIAVDHQYKVVRKVKGKKATQSFCIMGDGGVVLGYYAVPDTHGDWLHDAFMEIVERHGAMLDDESKRCIVQGSLPPIIYVDTGCCGGKAGRNDGNKWLYGMLKKLDAFHLTNRIGRQINSEHPRKGQLMSELSKCIFTSSQEDTDALNNARQEAGLTNLSSPQKKADRTKFVRRVILNPKKIVARMLLLMKKEIAIDKQAIQQHRKNGDPCVDISTAHDAYPLITKKVSKCAINQARHILNGCVHDEAAVNISMDTVEYRKTGHFLRSNKSTRGTNRCEQVHSVMDRMFYVSNNIRQLLFDARGHWAITNYNRARLKSMGKPALNPGVAPVEDDSCPVFVASTNLKFGFQYLDHIMNTFEKGISDDVRNAIEEDSPATVDILDEDDDVDPPDDSAEIVSIAPSLDDFAPHPIDMDIPDTVDMVTLEQISKHLDTAAVINTAAVPGPQDALGSLELDADAAMRECNDMADQMGQAAGIDTASTFAGINLLQQDDVNPLRNVRTRQAQVQQVLAVGPSFNDAMKAKWIELWSTGANPGNGTVVFKTWYEEKAKEYRIWMYQQLGNAVEQGTRQPQLLDVSYQGVKEWVDEMKKLGNTTLRAGAINSESAELVQRVGAAMETSAKDDNVAPFVVPGGMGVALDRESLQLNVSTEISENVFEPPTSSMVKDIMPALASKKAKKGRVVDIELQQRRAKAQAKMALHGINADKMDGSKRRCGVCDKYFGFEFGDAKHVKGIKFCPLVDDIKVYQNHLVTKKQREKEKRKIENRNTYENTKKKREREDNLNSM